MNNVSVVIPMYNHWELTHQTLYDLFQHCRKSISEVLIVNDASTENEVYDGLHWWKIQSMLPIRELRLSENHKFLLASNKGLKKAQGDFIFLLSNDVRIFDNFIQKGIDCLTAFPNDAVGVKLYNFDTGWNSCDGVFYPYLDGCLLGATKELWEKTNYLDERYAPYDFEDVDWSTTVKSLGGNLIELNTSVQHLVAQTNHYSPEREKITKRNRERFFEKWTKK